jgi:hypothetical protein
MRNVNNALQKHVAREHIECRSALQGATPFVTKNNIATPRYALKLLSL